MNQSTAGVPALSFQGTTFDLVEHTTGQPWLRGPQIAGALGYKDGSAITRIYARNAAEFTDSMTCSVNLTDQGQQREVRIFSLRGAHLLGMLARTKKAAEFRHWVLDVLEHQAPTPAPALPAPVPATFDRVVAERDTLRAMLAERVLREEPHLRKVLAYYQIEQLSNRERSTLMGWKSVEPYMQALKKLHTLGLVHYEPDAGLSQRGRENIAKLHQMKGHGHAAPPKPAKPAPKPWRMRPGAGRKACGGQA